MSRNIPDPTDDEIADAWDDFCLSYGAEDAIVNEIDDIVGMEIVDGPDAKDMMEEKEYSIFCDGFCDGVRSMIGYTLDMLANHIDDDLYHGLSAAYERLSSERGLSDEGTWLVVSECLRPIEG